MVRATQCLPELVRLQQQLYEMYHRKINQVEANTVTVSTFINEIKSSESNYF